MSDRKTLPVLDASVLRLLRQGRAALAKGQRAKALATFEAAMRLDARAACHPWSLLPVLKAEGRASIRPRMKGRLQDWYRRLDKADQPVVVALSHKERMRDWAAEHGFRTARLLGRFKTVAAIPPALLAEPRIVVKPVNGSSNRGVSILIGDVDHMTNTVVGPDRGAWLAQTYAAADLSGSPVLIEEALIDCEAHSDPSLIIPRDFKVFAIGGQAVLIRVHDRNGPDGKRGLITYDRLGGVLPVTQTNWPEQPPTPGPQRFADLVAEAERASTLLPWLLRFDFYLTSDGPVLGEITTYPNAGRNFSAFAQRTLLQMWELMPD